MRNGILQSVMCLVGIQGPAACNGEINWKNAKNVHHLNTQKLGKSITLGQDLEYFASRLANERNFVKHLDTILIPRTVGSEGSRLVRNYIGQTMSSLGWEVEQQQFTEAAPAPYGKQTFTNVMATLEPGASRRLVLACHYDSKIDPPGFLAATDSAVPCAMMLNLAQTLRQELRALRRSRPELTLQFLFFDGEEAFKQWNNKDSIYGSRRLAAAWENSQYSSGGVGGNYNDRIDMFVLLDLLGAKGMTMSKLESSTGDWYDNLVRIEKSLKDRSIIPQRSKNIFNANFLPAGIEDDHIPFKRRGVPILHLIAYPFPREWHKIGDNRASLDFGRIASLNRIMRVFVAEYLHLV